jgi:hypothetical protein
LIALGACAVHQLRYLAAYGAGAAPALSAQGHAYLETILPLLLTAVASSVLGTVAVAAFGRCRAAPRGVGWAFCAAAVLGIFVLQETAVGLLAAGHPGGLAAVLGHGGWIAVPIAVLVGRLLSLLLTGLASVERRISGARTRRVHRAVAALGGARALEGRPLACRTLVFGLARRPPPILAW